jgi:hypothetical protein
MANRTQPRRRWALPALIVGLLVVGLVMAAVSVTGPLGDRSGTTAVAEVASVDDVLEPAAAEPSRKDRRDHRPLRLAEGEKVVAGSVSSITDGTLAVRKDNGVEVKVPTNADTKVRGTPGKALSELAAGQRVLVKVGADGVADGVLVARAHAAGTVTKLEGDRATVVRANGLSVVLDLSAVSQRPAIGTVVVAVGTAADDSTIKVTSIRELPTLG